MNNQWYMTEGLSNNTYGESKSSQKEQSKSSSKQYPENDARAITHDMIMYTSGYFFKNTRTLWMLWRENSLPVTLNGWYLMTDYVY